ncbi:6-pyruvoyl-tetrahydropterin synthase-related protein [soil metagenome]
MKKYLPLILVIVFGILAGKGLVGSGYFNMHDDLQMMRQLEMEKCILTLQIPCRWVPDMGFGFGFPLFNFYPPLPYLFGEIFRLFGIAFVDTVKLTFISAFVASGISMYYLSKEFFGKWGGVISAIFYMWAPYHSVDIYVRGAMNESWGVVFFPVILLLSYRLITQQKSKTKNIIFLALGWVGLLLSHNLMAMIFAPVFAGWCIIWLLKSKNLKNILNLIISGVLSLGLVSFFTLPVLIEQKFVQTSTLIVGYYDFSAHFATIKQLLFSRFWGYGPSVWTDHDGLSFQVGYLHWILPAVIFGVTAFWFWKKRKLENWMIIILYFFIVGWLSVFMIHNKSTFIWLNINTLRYVQFPWRFLTLVILAFSFMMGGLVMIIPKKMYWIIFAIVGGLLIMNWNYFLPQSGHLGPLTDNQKFTGAAWEQQQSAGIYDYLPNTVKMVPNSSMKNFVEVLDGSANVTNINLGTNKNSFDIDVINNVRVRLGLFQFPDWRVYVDGKIVNTFIPDTEQLGRIYFLIPNGKHHVSVELHNTPIRNIGNIISVVSWIGLGGYLMLQFKRGRR